MKLFVYDIYRKLQEEKSIKTGYENEKGMGNIESANSNQSLVVDINFNQLDKTDKNNETVDVAYENNTDLPTDFIQLNGKNI